MSDTQYTPDNDDLPSEFPDAHRHLLADSQWEDRPA